MCSSLLLEMNDMKEILTLVTLCIDKLSDRSSDLIPLLQTLAVIIALSVIGLMVWKGKP
jgi:hypothetical protein